MKGPSGSPYDFVAKIADFGLYSRVRTARAKASGAMGLDQSGNQRCSKSRCDISRDIVVTSVKGKLTLLTLLSS